MKSGVWYQFPLYVTQILNALLIELEIYFREEHVKMVPSEVTLLNH